MLIKDDCAGIGLAAATDRLALCLTVSSNNYHTDDNDQTGHNDDNDGNDENDWRILKDFNTIVWVWQDK